MTYRVGYFVGSLASDSINRKLAAALVRLAPSDMEFIEIPIRNLPLYSRDYDAGKSRARLRAGLFDAQPPSAPDTL